MNDDDFGPGMKREGRCSCGALLTLEDGERCADCRPRLSIKAQAVAEARRQAQENVRALELATAELEIFIRKLDKKVRRHGYYRPERHCRHSRKVAGGLEAS